MATNCRKTYWSTAVFIKSGTWGNPITSLAGWEFRKWALKLDNLCFCMHWPRERKQELGSECINRLQSISSCPGNMARVWRTNLDMTGSDKNNVVELDQRNLPSMYPFVKSILGRPEAASNTKKQSGAWGAWLVFASIRWQGRNCSSAAARCCENAGSWLPTTWESSRWWSVFACLIRSSISGQDYTQG